MVDRVPIKNEVKSYARPIHFKKVEQIAFSPEKYG
jgi:hypothetical protein